MPAHGRRKPDGIPENPCPICGGKRENPHAATCYGCFLDGLLPADYERREKYVYVPAFKHSNATRKPTTGNAVLDGTPLRASELDLPPGLYRDRPLDAGPVGESTCGGLR